MLSPIVVTEVAFRSYFTQICALVAMAVKPVQTCAHVNFVVMSCPMYKFVGNTCCPGLSISYKVSKQSPSQMNSRKKKKKKEL